ncbi:MAG TPA: cytochrome c-type biogenesis protein [Gammaproteobacteria bacterium]
MNRYAAKSGVCALLLCLLFSVNAQNSEVLQFSQPEYKERYYALIEQLRCMVCQNQTIAESNAELAVDLRARVFEMVERGASEDEVIEFMAARYGNFVLYNPPFKTSTVFLWFAPFIVIGLGSIMLVTFIVNRNRDTASGAEVSTSIRRRAEELTQRNKQQDSDS